MKQIIIIIYGLVVMALVSACSFTTEVVVVTATPEPTEVSVEQDAPPLTATAIPSLTLTTTATVTATLPPTSTPITPTVQVKVPTAIPTSCVVRADWQLYSVVAGDTMSNIATRVGTTVAELIIANCIVNANYINVGQTLRVPRQPIVIVPTATMTPLPNPDPRPLVYVSEGQPLYDQCVVMMRQDRTSETTPLFHSASGNETPFALLGNWGLWVSTSNGFHQITVLSSGQGISAYVRASDTEIIGTSCNQTSNEIVTLGDIQISPHLAAASRTFDLRAGDNVTLTWTNAPGGVASATFYIVESDGSRTFIGRDDYGADGWATNWIVRLGLNGNYIIAEGSGFNSASFKTALSFPVTLFSNWEQNRVCVAQNIAPLPIYRMPGTDSEIIGELPANTQWLVLAFATDNWLAVRGGGGWVSGSMQVNTTGRCTL